MHCSWRAVHRSHDGPIVREPGRQGFLLSQQARAGRSLQCRASKPKVRWWSATMRSLSRFAPARRPHAGRRLRLECLEDRTMLSTVALAVNSQFDDPSGPTPGYTTLRDAITQADADPTNSYLISLALPAFQGGYKLEFAVIAFAASTYKRWRERRKSRHRCLSHKSLG